MMDRSELGADPYVEAASVKRDREITAALIYVAGDVVCCDAPSGQTENHIALQDAARAFLRSWWSRKTPKLEMPGGLK